MELFAVLAGETMNRRGRLVCLEPNPATAELLCANLRAHGLTDASVVQAAAWSSTTALQFAPDQPGTAPALGLPQPYPFRTETALDHLGRRGFQPQVILDAGAAKGYWSELASHFFPQAQFYLLEPLSRNVPYLKELSGKFPNIHFISCTAGESQAGESQAELFINVTPGSDGSSLLSSGRAGQPQDEKVKVVTIDSLLANGTLRSPQLVKLAVQGYELRALAGGVRLFDTTEVFLLEASLYEFLPGTPLFHEVVAYMAERGYVVFDVAGFLKRPFEDDLAKVELVFVKRDSPLVAGKPRR